MTSDDDRTFEEMTKKVMLVFQENREVYLSCEGHPATALKNYQNGYMGCAICGWRITLEQARTIANDVLVAVSELFDRLDSAIVNQGSPSFDGNTHPSSHDSRPMFDNDSSHSS